MGPIILVGQSRWLPGVLRNIFGLEPCADLSGESLAVGRVLKLFHRQQSGAAGWALSHTVARLLCRAGVAGRAVIKMSEPTPSGSESELPVSAALCEAGERTLVVDVLAHRVIEISRAVANNLNGNFDWVDLCETAYCGPGDWADKGKG